MILHKKRLVITGCQNLRDLGGFETKSNRITKWQTIYRGDMPMCNEEGWKRLYEEANVRCVIDLRSFAERTFQPYSFYHEQITYLAIPLLSETQITWDQTIETKQQTLPHSMAEKYLDIVLSNPTTIVQILLEIERHVSNGAIFIHCTAGKDRTGILSFFLLWLAGVRSVDMMADYQVSSTYAYYGNSSIGDAVKQLQAYDTSWMHAQPEALGLLIDYFTQHSMEGFLIENGMSWKTIQSLKEKITE